MYTIKIDGKLMYSPMLEDRAYKVFSPKLNLELNAAGSLTFVAPPGNVCYNAIRPMKSIVTVEQDGEEIFRGRVLDESSDFYNQKNVYCEGGLSFLLDSVQRPYDFNGTAGELFTMYINAHNEQVDESKQFAVGMISEVYASTPVEKKVDDYVDTSTSITDNLLDVYGGYIRTRFVDGVQYIDYIDSYNSHCGQTIEFGKNLLDIDKSTNAQDVFTVLIPLGALQRSNKPLTIAEVNGGLDYIEDEEAIAEYGRIVKTQTWDYVKKPAVLLEKAREYMKTNAVGKTLSISAVDLHLLNVNTDKIKHGDTVTLKSAPHGMNDAEVCSAISLPIDNPDQANFTFGEKARTLADLDAEAAKNIRANAGRIGRVSQEQQTFYELYLESLDEQTQQLNQVSITLDAVEAKLDLKASQTDMDAAFMRLTSAEVKLDGINGTLSLYATKADLTAADNRLSEAIIKLNGSEGEITAKVAKDGVISAINMSTEQVKISADKIVLDGYVTTSSLETEVLDVVEDATIVDLTVTNLNAFNLSVPDGTITANALTVTGYADVASLGVEDLTADSIETASLTIGGNAAATQSYVTSRGYITWNSKQTSSIANSIPASRYWALTNCVPVATFNNEINSIKSRLTALGG